MKRIALIVLTLISILGGLLPAWLTFDMTVDLPGDLGAFAAVILVLPSALGLLAIAGSLFAFITTKGFSRWNGDLSRRTRTTAIASWAIGVELLLLFTCLLSLPPALLAW